MDLPSCRKRMGWLIGVHIILAAAPALQILFWGSDRLLLFLWVFTTIPFGSAMTLSVWLGLGGTRIAWRFLTTLISIAYLAAWLAAGNFMMSSSSVSMSSFVDAYLEAIVPFGTVIIFFGFMFLLLGLAFKIRHDVAPAELPQSGRFQFSVLHVLIIMTLVAVILSLLRVVRGNNSEDPTVVLGLTADDLLGAIIFLLNAGCAAYAALWPSNVKRNVAMVLLVSTLLGVVIAFATQNDESEWWLFVGSMFIGIIPTVVVIASLLVVRSCGYRLVRRIGNESPAEV